MPKKLSREQILRKERRLVRVPVDVEILARQLQDPTNNGYRLELVNGIPSDSVFITAYYSMDSAECYFVYAHELFEEVPEGEVIPVKTVTIHKVRLDDSEDA